jgi:hypothetical protein
VENIALVPESTAEPSTFPPFTKITDPEVPPVTVAVKVTVVLSGAWLVDKDSDVVLGRTMAVGSTALLVTPA